MKYYLEIKNQVKTGEICDFSGCSMVKTLCFHCRQHGLITHATWCGQKEQKNKTKNLGKF